MGASSSSPLASSESSSSSPRKSGGSRLSRTTRKLSNFFCASSSSKSTFQGMEDHTDISSISCTKNSAPIEALENPVSESSSVFTSEAGDTISNHENGVSSDRSSVIEEPFLESSPSDVEASIDLEPLSHQPAHDATSEGTDLINPSHDQSTDRAVVPISQSNDLGYSHNAVVRYNSSDLRSLSIVSGSLPRFLFPGNDDHTHVTTNSSSGFVVSDSDHYLRSGDLLRLDLVSISSNTLSGNITEANSDESRRNSLRLFWDALSRRSLRRHSDAPTFVFATGLADDLGSYDRWLFDFSGDLHYYGAERDHDSFSSRRHRGNERRRLLRSEASEATNEHNDRGRNEGGRNEGRRQTGLCSAGLHLNGSCACDSFFTAEESTSLASISRIIMLAEALFEVLDEIQLQSMSLSMPTLLLPAPESVVDSFPLKYHKKMKNVAESDSADVRQCYICLCDYEEGDELRVLPCSHEYHVPCIDKWLKEMNRVCPLCRQDVCGGSQEV